MSLVRKTATGNETIAPGFYRTFVCTQAYYTQHSADIPNGTLVYITDDTAVTPAASLLESVYPVGSVYITIDGQADPATLFGFGTWSKIPSMYILRQSDSDANVGNSDGANTITLTAAQIPNHTHDLTNNVPTVTSTFTGTAATHTHNVWQNTNNAAYAAVYSRGSGSSYQNGGVALPTDTGTKAYSATNAANAQLLQDASITPAGTIANTVTMSTTSGNNGNASPTAIAIRNLGLKVNIWRRTA